MSLFAVEITKNIRSDLESTAKQTLITILTTVAIIYYCDVR